MPLPKSPGITVSVDCFGSLPITPRGNLYTLLFTDRFSRHADMYAVTAANFTAAGTAGILIDQYITLWGCPVTLISCNGRHCFSKLSRAIYARLRINKINTSAYHPSTNGGVERVNHVLAQMLSIVVNELQTEWEVHLPHVASAYNNSVNDGTGLAPNEVHLGRLRRLPLSVSNPRTSVDTRVWSATTRPTSTSPPTDSNAPTSSSENSTPSPLRVCYYGKPLHRGLPPSLSTFSVGGRVWIYNSASTIRHGPRKDTDAMVLKTKLSLNWNGPFKILAVGPTPASDTPDNRPLERKLLFLDLPTDLPGRDSIRRVSVERCKPYRNLDDIHDIPKYLPSGLNTYTLPASATKSPPCHVTLEDVSAPPEHLQVEQITGHQLVRYRGGANIFPV